MLQNSMDKMYHKLPYFSKKTGGLFDEGFASDKRYVTGNDSATDLLTAIDNGSDILSMDDMMENFNPSFGDLDPFADASLDSFVDLSEYLMKNSTLVADVTPDTMAMDDAATSATNKRSWAEDEEIVGYVEASELPATPDHDYSAKRPKLTSASDNETHDSPCTSKNKYRVRREKNNVASKRSREIRKNKFTDMEEKANTLVVANEEMRGRIIELEALAKEMRTVLVARLSGK